MFSFSKTGYHTKAEKTGSFQLSIYSRIRTFHKGSHAKWNANNLLNIWTLISISYDDKHYALRATKYLPLYCEQDSTQAHF